MLSSGVQEMLQESVRVHQKNVYMFEKTYMHFIYVQ